MAKAAPNLEWRINVPDGTSPPREVSSHRRSLWGYLRGALASAVKFVEMAWRMGASDPKKAIHCVKVGVALSLVEIFYYTRPLYDSVGGNAMWAVMTVVVVFEYTVGATLCKCINRVTATFLGGLLGLGVHWAAHRSGSAAEPVILGVSVFLLASAATFSRFIPSIKARFDYGAMIFILTFNLVSVSGYRVDKLINMAHQRVSTIAIGVSLCIAISMFVFPVWAGDELHQLIHRNMDKLSDSLEGCVTQYFKEEESKGDNSHDAASYKCVLNSKAAEETLANFARWEPAHGHIGFRHPWKEYTNIGALMRSCAYCIETLNACVNSQIQAPQYLKSHVSDACMALCLHSSEVLKELATCLKSMTRSSKLSYLVEKMKFATQEVQEKLNALPGQLLENHPSLREVVPLVTMMSLLVEVAKRIEVLADRVMGLAELAKFKSPPNDKTTAKIPPMDDANSTEEANKDITKS